jgi:predicted nucleic acid-binding protein
LTTLVLDANVVVRACQTPDGFDFFGEADLLAPRLMWSEARSAIREILWRGEIDEPHALAVYERLGTCPVEPTDHPELHDRTWRIAIEFGFARTYDAEYVALAQLLGCQLVTGDHRLWRGTERLGFVIAPIELEKQSS